MTRKFFTNIPGTPESYGVKKLILIIEIVALKSNPYLQTVEIPEGSNYDVSNYILRGKVPYMVQLHACIQSDSTVFLVLQYIRYSNYK